ncbi:MAG TPA: transporter substrate-binding domain-containing protein [Burkholderiaceae bacterium]|nr:transporter substrate-binding domain-containing protein [Burkholderiaceae bacterium]
MRRGSILALLLVAAACSFANLAAAAELRLLAAELPPYSFHVPPPTVSEFGKPTGAIYDIVRKMAQRVGHSGRIEFMPWTRAQEIAESESGVGILALTRTPEREPRYSWIAPIVIDDLVLVGGTGVDVSSLDKVKDRPTGVLRRSGAEALLREQRFTRISPASEEWINAQKLRDRLIDAWLAPRLMVLYGYREVGGDVTALNIGQIVRRSDIYLAGSKDLPAEEIERWRSAFEALKADGTVDRIIASYSSLRPDAIPGELRRPGDEIRW